MFDALFVISASVGEINDSPFITGSKRIDAKFAASNRACSNGSEVLMSVVIKLR